jgi:DNA repair exonuclease SbcCD nuclease subunit
VTRLLHVSDTHLGKRQYGSDLRRADFAAAFEQAIAYAVDEAVDAVIHTGDLFDSRDPRLLDLNRCIDILEPLAEAGIPFYGIVGNHERKMRDQYLDLMRRAGAAERLTRSPTLVNGDVALYGIDAVTRPAWPGEDFALKPPPEGALTLLCMHQLLHPPVPELFAEHPLEDVLQRVNVELDAIALGDYHAAEETMMDGTKVWYAGSTERCARDETAPRSVSLLEVEGGTLTRKTKELDTRPFLDLHVEFAEGDGRGHAEAVIDRHDTQDKVVMVVLQGEEAPVSPRDVRELILERGAAVCRVKDERGGPERELKEGPSGAVQSVDRLIDDMVAGENLSDTAREIERRVRRRETATTNLADEIETMIRETRDAAADAEGDLEDGLQGRPPSGDVPSTQDSSTRDSSIPDGSTTKESDA